MTETEKPDYVDDGDKGEVEPQPDEQATPDETSTPADTPEDTPATEGNGQK